MNETISANAIPAV